jgi:hypothetical protein
VELGPWIGALYSAGGKDANNNGSAGLDIVHPDNNHNPVAVPSSLHDLGKKKK